MNSESENEVTPGLTRDGVRFLEQMEQERRRGELWLAFCWLAGIALASLFLLALHPFLTADHFMFFVILSPVVAYILGAAVWVFPQFVRDWPTLIPSIRADALSERLRDHRYQSRRLTRLLVAVTYHAHIPACEIEAAWQALNYAKALGKGSRKTWSYEDGQRIRRAEAMYRVWKAEYDRMAPERAIAEAQAEMERAIAMSADWRSPQD